MCVSNAESGSFLKCMILGAKGSIWLDGDHPTGVGYENIGVKACIRVGDICCAYTVKGGVDVKKCSKQGKNYFVYYLRRAPGHRMRYCAGK